jgi:hypothetical protein
MKTSKVISGLSLLPFLAGVAFAQPNVPIPKQSNEASAAQPLTPTHRQSMTVKQPMLLNEKQMDGVTAGAMTPPLYYPPPPFAPIIRQSGR